MWIRRTRLTLAIALLISVVILAWLAGHPSLYSGHIGRLVTRHVLSDLGLSFACRDIAGNPLRALRFYDVVMTRDGRDDEFAYLSCDSLDVRYELNSFFSDHIVIPEITLHGPRLSVRRRAAPTSAGLSLPARPKAQVALRLDVERLRVRRGEVDLQDPRWEAQQNFRAIDIESQLRLDGDEAELAIDQFRARWVDGPYEQFALRGLLARSGRRVQLKETQVAVDSLEIRAAAELELPRQREEPLRWKGDVTAQDLDLARLLEVFGKPLPIALRLRGQAELESQGEGLRIAGRAAGQLMHYEFDFSRLQLRIEEAGIEFERAEGSFQGASVRAGGRLDTQSDLLTLSGSAGEFDLSQPWKEGETGWPATRVDGDFRLELALDDSKELNLELTRASGQMQEIEVDSLRARLRILPERGLTIHSARGLCNGTLVELAGEVGAEGDTDLDFVARSADAAPWLREQLPQWSLLGVRAGGSLRGPSDALALSVRGEAEYAQGPQLDGEGLRYVLDWSDLRAPKRLSGSLQLDSLRLREFPLGTADIAFSLRDDALEIERLRVARGDSSLVAGGRVLVGEPATRVELDSLRIQLGELAWWLPEARALHVSPRTLATDDLRLVGERGSLRLDGAADLDGAYDLRIDLEQTDLSLLRWAGLSPFDCAGILDGQLELGGSAADPNLLVSLSLHDARLREQRADSLHVALRGDRNRLTLREFDLRDQRGRLRAAGRAEFGDPRWLADLLQRPASFREHWPSAQLEATVSARDVSIDQWLPRDDGEDEASYGTLRARLDIFGSARRPRVGGQVVVSNLRNSALQIPELSASVQADSTGLRFERGSIATDHQWLEFNGAWPLALSASEPPRMLDNEGLRLHLRSPGDLDLAPLAVLFPAIELAEGSGRFDFQATGDPRNPRLAGSIQVRATRLRLRDLSEEFRDVQVDGRFHDGLLELTRVSGLEGEKGRVDATGEIRFAGLEPDDLTAEIRLHRLLLLSVPELRAIVSSEGPLLLTLRRPSPDAPRVPHVVGQLTIDRARYNGEFTGGESAGGGVLQATSAPPWTAELQIALRDQIRISNSVAELLMHGDVDLTRDLSGLRLRGVAEVASGRVSVARLLDFEITEGRLDFSRGSNLEPIVEITAETDVPVDSGPANRQLEHVTVRVSGTFAAPRLSFSSQSGYDEKTIINLLAGLPVDQVAEGTRLQAVALRMAGQELTGALADAIGGIDTIDLSTDSGSADGSSNLGVRSVGLGKYLDIADKPLYLRYTEGLSVSERDIYLEYQLRRRFLLTFEVRRRLRENAADTEFNADLKFRVEY